MPPKAAPAGPDPATLQVNGNPVTQVTRNIKRLAPFPILQAPVIRGGRTFLGGANRQYNEEAWLVQERGTPVPRACDHCRKKSPSGPFTQCIVLDGHVGESCANCHYGGNGHRCSLRAEFQNAQAQAIVNNVPAPVIGGMAPANNFGGSIANAGGFAVASGNAGGFTVQVAVVPVAGGAAAAAVLPAPTPGIARGGGRGSPRRIAPTSVDRDGNPIQIGSPFGNTAATAVAHARTLTADQRRDAIERLQRELDAVTLVARENGEEDI